LVEHGVPPSNGAIWSAVARFGLSYQKDAPGGRAEPAPAQAGDRTDIAARRRTWQCTTMRAEDVTATLDLALRASGLDEATPTGRPPLLSDNGSSYIAGELAERLEDRKIKHVRGAPYHPITQGRIERWHQTLKNRILLENYFLPGDLENQIAAFVDYYNNHRYHESIDNLTPADVYFGRGPTILTERERIKRQTIAERRLQYQLQA